MSQPAPEFSRNTPSSPASSESRRLWPFIVALAVVLFALVTVFGERGMVRELQYRRDKLALEQQLQQIETENAGLRHEIEALRTDGQYIEAIARRELGMVKPDEIIYQFPPSGEKSSTVRRPAPRTEH